MFATYLTAGLAAYVIVVIFAVAICRAAGDADRRMGLK